MNLFRAGLLFLFVMTVSLAGTPDDYRHIQNLIDEGDLESARNELGSRLAGEFSDWEGARLAGIVQPDGNISISYLEKSLILCKNDCEDIIARLASALYSAGDYDRVIALVEDNEVRLRDRELSFVAYRFASLAYIRKGNFEGAEKIIRKADKLSGSNGLWVEIQRANCQYLNDRKKDAIGRLNQVISAGGPASFAALYNRTYFYARGNDADRAYSGFTMLKEAHDDFIGATELLELLEGRSKMGSDGTAEKLTGVRYTIQIGTYADKEELDKAAEGLRKDGWSTFETSKFIDGRKYWMLTVGSFQTVDKAQRTKKILEDSLKTSLKVIILE